MRISALSYVLNTQCVPGRVGCLCSLLEVDMPVHLCLYASLLEEATGMRNEIPHRACGHHRLVSTVTPGVGTHCIAGKFHRFHSWPNIL